MRLFLLTALTMTAFAANSVLNRAGVGAGRIGAVDFAVVRLLGGAATLAALTTPPPPPAPAAPAPAQLEGLGATPVAS